VIRWQASCCWRPHTAPIFRRLGVAEADARTVRPNTGFEFEFGCKKVCFWRCGLQMYLNVTYRIRSWQPKVSKRVLREVSMMATSPGFPVSIPLVPPAVQSAGLTEKYCVCIEYTKVSGTITLSQSLYPGSGSSQSPKYLSSVPLLHAELLILMYRLRQAPHETHAL
jgi:hypothetical protein